MSEKNNNTAEKTRLHPRSKHRERYDFPALIQCFPALASFVQKSKYGEDTIDFADSAAVKTLNQSLLKHHYGIARWDIPEGYLCPPIPGRADYIHNIADILCRNFFGNIPNGAQVKGLDIGIGANCVYPIIGVAEYGWTFIGTDIDTDALINAQSIVSDNEILNGAVDCRIQENKNDFFYGILAKNEKVDFTICNPPFHASAKDAKEANLRKVGNLSQGAVREVSRNFGGMPTELIYEGGEERFLRNMIRQSIKFSDNCLWFSSLVSKQSNVRHATRLLEELEAVEIINLAMGQGNKSSRMIAWTFQTKEEQKAWVAQRWRRETVQ